MTPPTEFKESRYRNISSLTVKFKVKKNTFEIIILFDCIIVINYNLCNMRDLKYNYFDGFLSYNHSIKYYSFY